MSMSKRETSDGVRIVPARYGEAPFQRRDTRKPASSYARNYGTQIDARGMAREDNTGS
jgi:hypothetical protein